MVREGRQPSVRGIPVSRANRSIEVWREVILLSCQVKRGFVARDVR
jgi:hypothetical protein